MVSKGFVTFQTFQEGLNYSRVKDDNVHFGSNVVGEWYASVRAWTALYLMRTHFHEHGVSRGPFILVQLFFAIDLYSVLTCEFRFTVVRGSDRYIHPSQSTV